MEKQRKRLDKELKQRQKDAERKKLKDEKKRQKEADKLEAKERKKEKKVLHISAPIVEQLIMRVRKMRTKFLVFNKHKIQGLCQLFLTVSWTLHPNI